MPKIAFIGAGSVEFTRNLVGDILAFDDLRDVEIALHDIDAERLETAAALVAPRRRGPRAAAARDRLARPARCAGRGAVRDQLGAGRRACGHRARLRGAAALRPAPDDRRHARHRRHLPRAAHRAGDARHRPRHGRGVPGRVAAELHQSDGDALLDDVRRHADHADRRALPLGAEHHAPAGGDRRGAAGRGVVRRCRHQPPVVHPAPRARRRGPLPAGRRGDRARPRAAAARARRHLPPPRLLPDRVERARRRVPALVHAPRRRDRAAAHPAGRVRAAQRGEPRRVRPGARPGGGGPSRSRSSAASSTRR